jgi:predicted amidohydrolase
VNTTTILRFIDKAKSEDVQIICFPEAQTVGYRGAITPVSTPVLTKALQETHRQIAKLCGEYGIGCVLGTETPNESSPKTSLPFNSALVISPEGTILGCHHKTKLTPEDAKNYTAGKQMETFELFGTIIGVVICFEGFRFSQTTAECVRQGAQLVFHLQNNTDRPLDWKIPIHHAMIVTRAAENTIWFASCNICQEEFQNSRSMIVAPDGRIFAQTDLKKEQLLVADVDIDLATRAICKFDDQAITPVLYGDELFTKESNRRF